VISNFTDIDDKIIKRANEEKLNDWYEIPRRYILYHLEVQKDLGNIPFHINPLVTKHIEDIKEFIKDLLKKDFAYIGKYGIYFDVEKYKYYGQLSGTNREYWNQELELKEDKKNPYDFALWKFKKEGEPYWKTEIGEGRPGWHIECSTMSSKYLGIQFDIHSGGQDLIFPHHENEIAQSEARFNVHPWVRYWLHFGFLKIKGEKMSKSLGNIIPSKEFINKYGKDITRFYLGSVHYRDPIDVNEESINQAISNYEYITSTIRTIVIETKNMIENLNRTNYLDNDKIKIWNELLNYEKKFLEKISDDFDMTSATSILLEATNYINKNVIGTNEFTLYYTSYEFYNIVSKIYGLWEDIFYGKSKDDKLLYELINLIIEIRNELRKNKNYNLSDMIRDKMRKLGIDLQDKGNETVYRFL
ncbi:MAG: cysteine--tRNA ligase, partial [Nanopusillaceae archaeon]